MRSASARALGAALVALTAAVPTGGASSGPAGRTASEPPGWVGGVFRTASGESVTVHVSTSYPAEQASPQAWAEFFAGLTHGRELESVLVRVATPAEVEGLCRTRAAGCYRNRELVMPGELHDGIRPESVARHEYGHHIGANRSNAPWKAVDWGAKRWATAAGICRRWREGTAFPGDGGDRYRLNPGEAFAEAYRIHAERKAGAALDSWGVVDGSFYPDAAALAAVEQDVVAPWLRPVTKRMNGHFRAGGPRRWTIRLAAPLDGELKAELRLPPGRLDTIELFSANGRVLARGLWSGPSTRRLSHLVCGERKLTLRVTAVGAPGRFALTVSRP